MIILSKDGWSVTIVPQHGASILKCTYEGHNVLHPAAEDWLDDPDPFTSSSFPLVPFSNRIKKGQFEFERQKVKLPQNHPQQAHVIHGNGWTSSWKINSRDEGACELGIQHEGGDWPWPFEVIYRIKASGAELVQTLSIKNTGNSSMPAGLGFHPYFPDRDNARIMFNATGIWEADTDMLPTEWLPQDGIFDFRSPTHLRDRHYDNCLTGWDGDAQIEWTDRQDKILIKGSTVLDHAVFYTPLDQPFFCFEPVSHGNNALADDRVMVRGSPMVLAAGETLHGEMRLAVVTV